MKTTRVLVVTHTGELGGAELALVRLLRTLDPSKWDVTVLTLSDGPLVAMLRTEGVDVVVGASDTLTAANRAKAGRVLSAVRFAGPTLRAARIVRAVARERSAQLVVANSLKAAVIVAIARIFTRQPWVWHLHDRLARDYLPRPAVALMRAVARLATVVIANSRATRDTLPHAVQQRSALAYPGVDTALIERRREEPCTPVVGMVGRISATKGQLEFVAAAASVLKTVPDAIFRIVGDAKFGDQDYATQVTEAASQSELGGCVELTGWTDDPATAIASLSVFVHASPVPEPFGQVVAEALALGVPVVAADSGGVPELLDPDGTATELAPGVREGNYGLLVGPGDAAALAKGIELALMNSGGARTRATRAVGYARDQLSIERTATQVSLAWAGAL